MNATGWAQPLSKTGEIARQCLENYFMPSAIPIATSTSPREVKGVVLGRWTNRSVHTRPHPFGFESHFLKIVTSDSHSDVHDRWLLSFATDANLSRREIAQRRLRQWMSVSVEEKQRQTQKMAELIQLINSERGDDSKIYR